MSVHRELNVHIDGADTQIVYLRHSHNASFVIVSQIDKISSLVPSYLKVHSLTILQARADRDASGRDIHVVHMLGDRDNLYPKIIARSVLKAVGMPMTRLVVGFGLQKDVSEQSYLQIKEAIVQLLLSG